MAADLTPVFSEEMDFLRDVLGVSGLPRRSSDLFLWNSGSSYFRGGRRAVMLRELQSGTPRAEVVDADVLRATGNAAEPGESEAARFVSANKEHLESLEAEATAFIRKTKAQYPGHAVMVAFSGGKDSTAASILCRRALGTGSVLHVFSDTTVEAPDTYAYLSEFQRENPRVPLVKLEPTASFMDMCTVIGPPSRILRWCCSSHKAAPMARIVSALTGDNDGVLTIDGIRASESSRRRKYERITTDAKIRNEILASPILAWSDLEVWAFLLAQGVLFNRGYRRGFRRVGCLPCPFNSRWSTYLAGAHYADWQTSWETFLRNHARRIGHPNPENFSQDGWRTRAGGNGLEHQRASLQKEECEREPRTFSYQLVRPWTDSALEFLKPLGDLHRVSDDGTTLKLELVDPLTRIPILHARISRPRSHLRVHFAKRSNLRLLVQRFERQLRKYQSCVLCGSCAANCHTGALSVNGRFAISTDRCNGCERCVSAPCVAEESLKRKGSSVEWRACDGSK